MSSSDWVAVPEVLQYWNSLAPHQRKTQDVPEVLTTLDEVADPDDLTFWLSVNGQERQRSSTRHMTVRE